VDALVRETFLAVSAPRTRRPDPAAAP
jgi:hypothetical protein